LVYVSYYSLFGCGEKMEGWKENDKKINIKKISVSIILMEKGKVEMLYFACWVEIREERK
jgi:hypothetical protein